MATVTDCDSTAHTPAVAIAVLNDQKRMLLENEPPCAESDRHAVWQQGLREVEEHLAAEMAVPAAAANTADAARAAATTEHEQGLGSGALEHATATDNIEVAPGVVSRPSVNASAPGHADEHITTLRIDDMDQCKDPFCTGTGITFDSEMTCSEDSMPPLQAAAAALASAQTADPAPSQTQIPTPRVAGPAESLSPGTSFGALSSPKVQTIDAEKQASEKELEKEMVLETKYASALEHVEGLGLEPLILSTRKHLDETREKIHALTTKIQELESRQARATQRSEAVARLPDANTVGAQAFLNKLVEELRQMYAQGGGFKRPTRETTSAQEHCFHGHITEAIKRVQGVAPDARFDFIHESAGAFEDVYIEGDTTGQKPDFMTQSRLGVDRAGRTALEAKLGPLTGACPRLKRAWCRDQIERCLLADDCSCVLVLVLQDAGTARELRDRFARQCAFSLHPVAFGVVFENFVNPRMECVVADDGDQRAGGLNVALKNISSTCFVNACVHAIFGIDMLVSAIIDGAHRAGADSLCDVLAHLIEQMRGKKEGALITPTALRDFVFQSDVAKRHGWQRGQQQDAQELLLSWMREPYFEHCHFDVSDMTYDSGQQSFRRTHGRCRTEPMLQVALEGCSSFVERACTVDALVNAEFTYLSGERSNYSCWGAGSGENTTELASALPDVLVVHLKRWRKGIEGQIQKDRSSVQLREELQICNSTFTSRLGRFKLRSVIMHIGEHGHGHYATYTLRKRHGNDVWLRFDDQQLHRQPDGHDLPVAFEQWEDAQSLFHERGPRGRRAAERPGREYPYILFYTKERDEPAMPAALEQLKRDTIKLLEARQEAHEKAERDREDRARDILLIEAQAAALVIWRELPRRIESKDEAVDEVVKRMVTDNKFRAHEDVCREAANKLAGAGLPWGSARQWDVDYRGLDVDVHGLDVWNDRDNWVTYDAAQNARDLRIVKHLVRRLIIDASDLSMRPILRALVNDPNKTNFVDRAEQTGKTKVAIYIAWLSNVCYGQAAYVFLRSGAGSKADYSKFASEPVDSLNEKLFELVCGAQYPSGNPLSDTSGAGSLWAKFYGNDLHKLDEQAEVLEIMKPYMLHPFHLHCGDKHLKNADAVDVLSNRYPILYARIGSPGNVLNACRLELAKIGEHYGHDARGFFNITLIIDEYQLMCKPGTKIYDAIHGDGGSERYLHRMLEDAVGAAEASSMVSARQEARSNVSAYLKGQVRITATPVSGLIESDHNDGRSPIAIHLEAPRVYWGLKYAAPCSEQTIVLEGVDGDGLVGVGDPCSRWYQDQYPVPGKGNLESFVLTELRAELMRDGFSHTLLQAKVNRNAILGELARFLINFANDEFRDDEKVVVAITSYARVMSGAHPGGPWMFFSKAAYDKGLHRALEDAAKLYINAGTMIEGEKIACGSTVIIDGHERVAISKGASLADGIARSLSRDVDFDGEDFEKDMQLHLLRDCSGACYMGGVQLPMLTDMNTSVVLRLVHEAARTKGILPKDMNVITVGNNMLKVGMTPKTDNHKMGVTLSMLSVTERKRANMDGEEVSQGIGGRINGYRINDEYFDARGKGCKPRIVLNELSRRQLECAKEITTQTVIAVATRDEDTVLKRMEQHPYEGMRNLNPDAPLVKLFAKPFRRAADTDRNDSARAAVKANAPSDSRMNTRHGFTSGEQYLRKVQVMNEDLREIGMPLIGDTFELEWRIEGSHHEWYMVKVLSAKQSRQDERARTRGPVEHVDYVVANVDNPLDQVEVTLGPAEEGDQIWRWPSAPFPPQAPAPPLSPARQLGAGHVRSESEPEPQPPVPHCNVNRQSSNRDEPGINESRAFDKVDTSGVGDGNSDHGDGDDSTSVLPVRRKLTPESEPPKKRRRTHDSAVPDKTASGPADAEGSNQRSPSRITPPHSATRKRRATPRRKANHRPNYRVPGINDAYDHREVDLTYVPPHLRAGYEYDLGQDCDGNGDDDADDGSTSVISDGNGDENTGGDSSSVMSDGTGDRSPEANHAPSRNFSRFGSDAERARQVLGTNERAGRNGITVTTCPPESTAFAPAAGDGQAGGGESEHKDGM